jgi:ATP-binding cassette subfamily F protein uup
MLYLQLENVSRSYGEKILLKNVSFSISKGDKIALIAKNGSGKTTLLKILAGIERAEGENAKVHFARGLNISFLNQDPEFDKEATVLETVFNSENEAIKAIRDYEYAVAQQKQELLEQCISRLDDLKAWDTEVRIKEVLHKLLLTDLDQKVGQMSGGQKKRLALARILIEEPEFVILDEPTNHLDLDMIEWLESYLTKSAVTLFMVTHDRYFLDNVCNEIMELDQGQIYTYRGNYTTYLEKKEARMQNEAANAVKTKKLYLRELEWMRRQPQARTTKAKSRIDEFYEIKDKAMVSADQDELKINIQASRLGSKILELHQVSKKYGEKVIMEPFSYKFKRGERIGIIGPNGTGKSTFLKLITRHIAPDTGKIVVGDTIVFGYYSQDGLILSEDKTVLEVIRDIAEYIPLDKGQKMTAETLLERFLFPRSQHRVYVSQLSGGEKRRLYLLTILMKNPNFLILDEPTNDLDILTLNVLEDYLIDFPGCLIIVTHDRYFMDKITDHIFVLEGGGKVRDFNGTYTEFRLTQKEKIKNPDTKSEDLLQSSSNKPVSNSKADFEYRKECNKIEKEIQKLEDKKAEILQQFESSDISPEKITELSKQLNTIQQQLEDKEMQWLELAEMINQNP